MSTNHNHGGAVVHNYHSFLDPLNWPVALAGVSLPLWAQSLWEHAPAPTAVYMGVSAVFMLFQMSDKLGWLDRFKRRPPTPKNPK